MLNKLAILLILISVGVFGYANIAGAPNIVELGLVSYWSFDEGTVTKETVKDVFGTNDGLITGEFELVEGQVGQGLRNANDAVTNYVQISSDVLLGEASITVWAMAENFTGTHYVFGHTTLPTWKDRVQIYCANAGGNLDLGMGDSHARHTGIATLEIEVWNHIGLTYDDTPDGNYKVYVNGELKAEGAFGAFNELMGFADIANDGAETGRDEGWLGVVDEFCLYDRVLSVDEVRQNYQATGLAVEPSGKLGAVWGRIKTEY